MADLLSVFLTATLVTALVTPLLIWLSPRIGAMDEPGEARRIHKKAVPCLGGLGIYLGITVSFWQLLPWKEQIFGVAVGGTLALILGMADDRLALSPPVKLAGQVVCALVVFHYSLQIRGMANFLPLGPRYLVFPFWLSVLVTVFWIVGIMNTVNLVDGMDGLAAGIVCIACLCVAYTSYVNHRLDTAVIILSVAGACLGFLLYNFYPAKVFMGDGGSMLLGFLLASVSLVGETPTKSTTLFSAILPVIILALPIFDTLFAIVRRMAKGRPIMQADRGHLHHRIMAMGFGQRRTVLALYSISAIMGVAGILWNLKLKLEAMALSLVAFTLIVIFLGIGIVEVDSPLQEDEAEKKEEEA